MLKTPYICYSAFWSTDQWGEGAKPPVRPLATLTSVRRIFERKAGNLRIMQTKKERSSLRISPFLRLNSGEDPKKGLHPHPARFGDTFFVQITKRGGHDSILRTILTYLCITGTGIYRTPGLLASAISVFLVDNRRAILVS